MAQMAFTRLNGFMLTTDGRLFSWGKDGPVLGRFVGSGYASDLIKDTYKRETRSIDIAEIDFPMEDCTISKIATGKEHVLALDTRGHVWTWGINSYG